MRYFLRELKLIGCHLVGLSWLVQWLGRKILPTRHSVVVTHWLVPTDSWGLTQPPWLDTSCSGPRAKCGLAGRPALMSSWLLPFSIKELGYPRLPLHQATWLSTEGSAHSPTVKFGWPWPMGSRFAGEQPKGKQMDKQHESISFVSLENQAKLSFLVYNSK